MARERKPISKKVRFDVFKRDSFACQYCGATPPGAVLHIDHIHPVAEGGTNHSDNLVTACSSCNLGKAATPLSVVPKSLAEKAAEASEREAQLRGYNDILRERADRIEDDAWEVACVLECSKELESYNRKRLASIKTFLNRLPTQSVINAAEKTQAKFTRCGESAFRYFCGICWNMIKEEGRG